jgi:hypothetical protein
MGCRLARAPTNQIGDMGKLSHYQPSEGSGSPESAIFPSFSSDLC